MSGAIELKCTTEAITMSYLLTARKGLRARKSVFSINADQFCVCWRKWRGENDYITLYRVELKHTSYCCVDLEKDQLPSGCVLITGALYLLKLLSVL